MIAISYPFTLNAKGKVTSSTISTKIYLDRVLTLLSTNIGQRPILQEYGTDLGTALFENDNDIVLATKKAIQTAMASWLPNVKITNITVSEPNEDGVADIQLDLVLPNKTSSSLNITTAIFNYDGTITRQA